MKYTDKATIENYLNHDIDEAFDDQLEEWIEAMSRKADRMAGRVLADDQVTEVLYDGVPEAILHVQDIAEITSIEVDGVELGIDEYTTFPRSKSYISRIKLMQRYWPLKRNAIKITGYHGMHKEVPTDIKFAVTVMVAGIMNDISPAEAGIKSERIGNYQAQYEGLSELTLDKIKREITQAEEIINRYRRIAL